MTYNGKAFSFVFATDEAKYEVTGGNAVTDAGSSVLTLTPTANYAWNTGVGTAAKTFTITVNKADRAALSVTLTGDDPASPAFVVAPEEASDSTVTWYYRQAEASEPVGEPSTIVPTEPGDYVVYATVSESTNYKSITSGACQFTIENV